MSDTLWPRSLITLVPRKGVYTATVPVSWVLIGRIVKTLHYTNAVSNNDTGDHRVPTFEDIGLYM